MRAVVFVVLLLFGLPLASAQPWVAQVKGAGFRLVRTSPDEDLVFLGGHQNGIGPEGDWDIAVVKTSPAGKILWAKVFGGKKDDFGNGMVFDEDGNLYVVGTTYSFGAKYSGIWVLKLDPNGEMVWQYLIDTNGIDEGKGITYLNGHIYVLGTVPNPDTGIPDVLILKFTPDGKLVWAKIYGGGMGDNGEDIVGTPDGKLVVAAYTQSFGADIDGNVWVFEVDEDGKLLWQKMVGGKKIDSPKGVAVTKDGRVIVVGTTRSFGVGGADSLILIFDENGNLLLQKTTGTPKSDEWSSTVLTLGDGFITGANYLFRMTYDGRLLWARKFTVDSLAGMGNMMAFTGRIIGISGAVVIVGVLNPNDIPVLNWSGITYWKPVSLTVMDSNATVINTQATVKSMDLTPIQTSATVGELSLNFKMLWEEKPSSITNTSTPSSPSSSSSSQTSSSSPAEISSTHSSATSTPSSVSPVATSSTRTGKGGICGPAFFIVLALLPLLWRNKL